MKELFEALLAALRRGETAALCTILGASEDGGVRRREHDWDGRRRRR